jgi:tetraacyldisaccharide 4'-kinase
MRGARRAHVRADGSVDAYGQVADEALLVALRTGAAVVTAVDRHEACRLAAWAFAPDLILLDDGFQHRRLWRDLDVVLVDPSDRTAPLLPAGPLREPWRALDRADVVIATARSSSSPYLVRVPLGLVRSASASADVEPLAGIAGETVMAFAGVARPDDLVSMLATAGADVRGLLAFDDHHAYTPHDCERIAHAARDVRRIVTTEKDLVKLAKFARTEERLTALRIGVEVEGGEALLELICARTGLDPKQRGQHDREAPLVRERR